MRNYMMQLQQTIVSALAAALLVLGAAGAVTGAEPNMAEYTSYPLFQTGAVSPRIMIVLDNSGSMNFPAYGGTDESVSYGEVVDRTFEGGSCNEFVGTVAGSLEDGKEQQDTTEIIYCDGTNSLTQNELDLGHDDQGYGGTNKNNSCAWKKAQTTAVRFVNVNVPPEVDGVPVVIKSAYIEFTAGNTNGNKFKKKEFTVTITAEDSDDAPALSTTPGDISGRSDTTASVSWTISSVWSPGSTYLTPDLSSIVQVLVDRGGWASGNAMLFKLAYASGNGGRAARDGSTGNPPRLIIEYEPCDVELFYGYFDPTSKYSYDGNKFVRDSGGDWDGNFLNFITMRRGDVLRKVLVGGLSTSRIGGGNPTQIGETPAQSSRYYQYYHSGSGVSPYTYGWYGIRGGYLYVNQSNAAKDNKFPYNSNWNSYDKRLKIVVDKDEAAEPNDFGDDGELAGVLQKVGDQAQWGNAWFNGYAGGGEIDNAVGTNITSLVTTIKNKGFNTWTPISETLYVVTQYFKQQDVEISGFKNNCVGPFTDNRDPYYSKDGTVEESCAQAFVILLTDGVPTQDTYVPDYLKDYDGDGHEDSRTYGSNGSDYADDVALYARTTDLRSATVGKSELDGEQNVVLYVVYAFGTDALAKQLLKETAINGGFEDSNGNDLPDLQSEWDADGDGVPDNYFEAQDGYKLEQQLMNAIQAILERAGSGTAVSVLATKGEGEGTLVQAFFNPTTATTEGDVKWTGHLHSLWVDDEGRIREDTVNDYRLDTTRDERIEFGVDNGTGDTVISRYASGASTPYETVPIDELRPIWSGGDMLADADPSGRNIYTYTGDGTEVDPHVNFTKFVESNVSTFSNFMGVEDSTEWSYLGPTEADRAVNLVRWVRGFPDDAAVYSGAVKLRRRTLNDGRLWKLGDIVNSTPVSMAQPLSDYDLIYDDFSYIEYYLKYKDRETVVFTGGNDGMLHAFTGGVYDSDNKTFKNPYQVPGYFTGRNDAIVGDMDIGNEMWAYIPQSLLPHLKWLPRTDYTHVYYVDLRPRVFDARIFSSDTTHPDGWGSVLVCGLNYGGKQITANPDSADAAKTKTFNPAFFAFDVTNPRDPRLLWERSFSNLGLAYNYPAMMKVDDNWLLTIGSGPTNFDGESTHDAHLYIVDLKTGGDTVHGGLYRDITVPGGNAFTNVPVALDKELNYNVDAIYFSANYNAGDAEVFRVTVPQTNTSFEPFADGSDYVADPADARWTLTKLFHSPVPITAPGDLSVDRKDNAWLYLGTGRYISDTDKTSNDQNYIIGIKDPFFNIDKDSCNYDYPAAECEINADGDANFDELFDADLYTVYSAVKVEGPSGTTTFSELLDEARQDIYQGWFRRLENDTPSERVLNKGAALGGVLLKPTFTPNTDPCGFGGSSRLFGVYYETGTAFFNQVFTGEPNQSPILDVISLGEGIASSLSIHTGREEGGKVYVQKSTGEIVEINVNPAFNIKSGPEYWIDSGYY